MVVPCIAGFRRIFVPVLFLGLVLFACGGDDDTMSRPSEVALEDVLTDSRALVDTSRPTRDNGDFPGADDRLIETRLWFAEFALSRPACGSRGCALVVLAHGFGGSTARFDAIGRRLAAAGYVVAAPTFPLTNESAPGGFFRALGDVVEQPADLSFVIDALLTANDEVGDVLYRRIDDRRVAVLGHSLGGATAIALTRSVCCTDQRVGAAVLVAPVVGVAEGSFDGPLNLDGPPTLTLFGAEDPIVPPESAAAFRNDIAPPKVYVELKGGGHVLVIEATETRLDPLLEETALIVSAFLDETLGKARGVAKAATSLTARGHLVEID